MIEMLGDLLRVIFALITKGEQEQAGQKLNEAFLVFLRRDASYFHNIPTEDLTSTLLSDHNYTQGHLEILAELLHAEARLQEARGNLPESRDLYEKSLKLFSFTDENNRTYSAERLEKMDVVRKRLDELNNV